MRKSKALIIIAVMVGVFAPFRAHALLKPVEVNSKSGVKAWLIEDSALPVISMHITFRNCGTSYDPADKAGLVAVLSRMFKEGAGKYSAEDFNNELENHAIELSFSEGEDDIEVEIRTLTRNFDKAIALTSDALNAPKLNDTDIKRVAANYLSDIKMSEQSPAFIAQKAWRSAYFGKHPYGRDYPDVKSLAAIKSADLKEFKHTCMSKDSLIISAVGDVNSDKLIVAMDSLFAKLPESRALSLPVLEKAAVQERTVKVQEMDVPQSVFVFALPWIDRQNPDYIASVLLNYIVGGSGFNSRLMQELREKNGLTYGIHTGIDNNYASAYLSGSFSTKNADAAKAFEMLKQQLSLISQNGVTAAELEQAKSYMKGSFPLNLDSNGKIAGFLGMLQQYNLGIDYMERRSALIDAVTLERVNQLAKTMLLPDKMVTGVAGKPEGFAVRSE